MDRNKVGFIGGGNMARAIAGGLVRSGFGARNILISEPAAEQRDRHHLGAGAAHATIPLCCRAGWREGGGQDSGDSFPA